MTAALLARLNRAFAVHVPAAKLEALIAVVRVVTGLMLVHYYLDVLGAASVAGVDAPAVRRRAVWVLSLAAGLTAGLLTPAVIVGLIVMFASRDWTMSLGDQATVILLWGLLMLGAGRTHSVDAVLKRTPVFRPLLSVLYLAAVPLTPAAVGWVRFGVLTLFWGCCVSAMLYHFTDDFWWKSHVLEVAFAMPYMNDHADAMASFRDGAPQVYVAVCAAGLIVQGVWELFLVPLMLCRVGRAFVCVQGLLFFAGSLALFNLQYLPVAEFILWALLFLPWAWSNPSTEPEPPAERHCKAGAFAAVCVVFFSAQLILCPYTTPAKWSKRVVKPWAYTHKVWRYMAQSPVCVFNKEDLQMGEYFWVLHEVDEAGNHLRTAPYLDDRGGRLSYLRNDLVYFKNSLRWQRYPLSLKATDGDVTKPTETFQDMFHRFAVYDALMVGSGERRYRVEFFKRDMIIARPATWSADAYIGHYALTVDAAAGDGWPVYQLPPGHFNQAERLRRTDETMKSIPQPEGQP